MRQTVDRSSIVVQPIFEHVFARQFDVNLILLPAHHGALLWRRYAREFWNPAGQV
jgi:hypothetical protein